MEFAQLPRQSEDLKQTNVAKLAELFPHCVTEGKNGLEVNFEVLHALLGGENLTNRGGVESSERFDFTWVGKGRALELAYTPTSNTLRPQKDQSKHWDSTENLYIEGDNLEVLKILQKSYANKIKMIYIDPPYNTGKDFIYKDNFHQSKQAFDAEQGVIDAEGNRLVANPESNGRFHSDWCSMIYSRLLLARDLLTDDGVIFISIDDNEQANLKKICDEVFGEGNFVADFIRKTKSTTNDAKTGLNYQHEFLLCYAKNKEQINLLGGNKDLSRYQNPDNDPNGAWISDNPTKAGFAEIQNFPVTNPYTGQIILPPKGRSWVFTKNTLQKMIDDGRICFKKEHKENERGFIYKRFLKDLKTTQNTLDSLVFTHNDFMNQSATKELKSLGLVEYFPFPKGVDFIRTLIIHATNPNDLILDFFSGSATTAHAVMQLNAEDGGKRKFICVQLPEACDEKSTAYQAGYKNICEIGKERIRRAGEKIINDESLPAENRQNLDIGFRVLSLDSTNKNNVQLTAQETTQLNLMESNIKTERSGLDLFFESLLDWGVGVNSDYQTHTVGKAEIHCYADGALVACFDPLTPAVIQKLSELHQQSLIVRLVLLNASFERDDEFINCQNQLKRLLPHTEIRVI